MAETRNALQVEAQQLNRRAINWNSAQSFDYKEGCDIASGLHQLALKSRELNPCPYNTVIGCYQATKEMFSVIRKGVYIDPNSTNRRKDDVNLTYLSLCTRLCGLAMYVEKQKKIEELNLQTLPLSHIFDETFNMLKHEEFIDTGNRNLAALQKNLNLIQEALNEYQALINKVSKKEEQDFNIKHKAGKLKQEDVEIYDNNTILLNEENAKIAENLKFLSAEIKGVNKKIDAANLKKPTLFSGIDVVGRDAELLSIDEFYVSQKNIEDAISFLEKHMGFFKDVFRITDNPRERTLMQVMKSKNIHSPLLDGIKNAISRDVPYKSISANTGNFRELIFNLYQNNDHANLLEYLVSNPAMCVALAAKDHSKDPALLEWDRQNNITRSISP
jgi:hypothetical protein